MNRLNVFSGLLLHGVIWWLRWEERQGSGSFVLFTMLAGLLYEQVNLAKRKP